MSSDSDDEDCLVSQGYRPSRNRDASEDDGPHPSKADRSTIRISEGVDEVSHCRDVLQHEHEGEDQHDGGREPGHLLLCFALHQGAKRCKEVQRGASQVQKERLERSRSDIFPKVYQRCVLHHKTSDCQCSQDFMAGTIHFCMLRFARQSIEERV